MRSRKLIAKKQHYTFSR